MSSDTMPGMSQPSKIIVDDRPMPTVPGRQLADHRLLEESPNSPDFNSGVPTHVPDAEPSGDALARQLNGTLMALLLYMGEIKQQSDKIAQTRTERRYLQAIVDNAVEQTERVCALVRQISGSHAPSTTGRSRFADQ